MYIYLITWIIYYSQDITPHSMKYNQWSRNRTRYWIKIGFECRLRTKSRITIFFSIEEFIVHPPNEINYMYKHKNHHEYMFWKHNETVTKMYVEML